MKLRKFSKWLIAILIVCLVSTFVLAACHNDDDDQTEATYYLSIDGATYSSESDVPDGVKFAKSDSVYTLTVELEAGKVLTVNKVGSTDKIGYDSVFSSAGKLTQGSNNSMVVAEKGTFAFTLDPSEPELTYAFTAASVGGGGDGGTAVTGVTLNKHELVLAPEGSEKLIATVLPATAINKNLLWTTSNSSVVSVEQDGTVTAVSAGTAKITVASQENGAFTDECTVTVRQGVTNISLSASTLTVYTGDGAGTRELEVTISPEGATNQDYTVSVEQSDEFIIFTKAGTTITITGKAVGTATLTVTSDDDPTLTAECVITVASIEDAAPALDKDNSTLDIDGQDVVNILLDNGEITSFTVTSSATGVATVTKSDSGNSFTVTGKGFGTATVTVVVSYGDSQTETLTLKVRVTAEYYFLTGNFDGTGWDTPVKVEGYLTTYKVLLEKTETDGIYEISRHFAANDKLYILPSTGDFWTNALKKSFYTAQSGGSNYFETPDNDNVLVKYAGNYTVRLDLRGTKASWTIIVDSIDIIGATITPSATSIKGAETATLTFAINPSVVEVAASGIAWSIKEAEYRDWVTLSVDGTAKSATLSLSDQFTGESVNVTIVVVVTIDGQEVATAEQVIALLGNTITPVTEVTFDDEGDILLDVSSLALGTWTTTVTAHVNGDASIQTVTYSIKEGNIYANTNDTAHLACSIDANGKLTAWMFGTYTVVATSDGVNSEGQPVSGEKTVRVYASTFYLNINWDTNHVSNPSTTTDNIHYTWTDVKIADASVNKAIVILYAGLGDSDDWYSVIRSSGYINSSASTSGVTGGTSGKNGNFLIKTAGMYNITLDLSGSAPSVTFIRTGDIVASDSWTASSKKIAIVGAGSYTWGKADNGNEYYTVAAGQTITNENPYVFVAYNFSHSSFSGLGNDVEVCALEIDGQWYMGDYFGSYFSSTWTSGKWYVYNNNGNLKNPGVSVYNTEWTFIVKFDEDANVVGVQIEKGTITSVDGFTDAIS